MSIIPWKNKRKELALRDDELFAPFGQFRAEMDRLFDRFFGDSWGFGDGGPRGLGEWMPSIDVADGEKEITLRAELPGVDPKDLDISVSGDVLTLSGEKRESSERQGESFYHAERRFGSFRRSLRLPAEVQADKVTAEHVNGVLTVRLPKQPGVLPKKVPVKALTK